MPYKKRNVICPRCGERHKKPAKQGRVYVTCSSCHGYKSGPSHPNWTGTEHVCGSLIWQWRNGAKQRDISWNLSADDIEAVYMQQRGLCAMTGKLMNMSSDTGSSADRVSLDRHDPARGYEAGNIQLVRWEVNRIKNNLTTGAFLKLAESIQLHRLRQASWGLVA